MQQLGQNLQCMMQHHQQQSKQQQHHHLHQQQQQLHGWLSNTTAVMRRHCPGWPVQLTSAAAELVGVDSVDAKQRRPAGDCDQAGLPEQGRCRPKAAAAAAGRHSRKARRSSRTANASWQQAAVDRRVSSWQRTVVHCAINSWHVGVLCVCHICVGSVSSWTQIVVHLQSHSLHTQCCAPCYMFNA